MSELKASPSEKEEKKRWSKSISKNGESKSVEVREIENGFLVMVSKDGKNSKGDWEYLSREFYSKTNPLEDEEDILTSEEKSIRDMKKSILNDSIFDLL